MSSPVMIDTRSWQQPESHHAREKMVLNFTPFSYKYELRLYTMTFLDILRKDSANDVHLSKQRKQATMVGGT